MNQTKEQSVKAAVKTIAQQENRTFNDVWQEVVLERWLARLAESKYSQNFIFKGAMCLLHYMDLQRETRDLDFLLSNLQSTVNNIKKYLEEISAIQLNDAFSFEEVGVQTLAHNHMQYPGYSASLTGQLGKTKTKIFIDIGIGDAVKPTKMTLNLAKTDKAPIFEKNITVWAYPVETIFAEKLETAISRSGQNSRMKDYHDLLGLLRNDLVDVKLLKKAIAETFSNRGTRLQLIKIDNSAISTMQNYWTLYLRALAEDIKKDLPSNFEKIIDEINQILIRFDLIETINA